MTTTELLQILTAMIGTLGFAILFNIRGWKLLLISLGGALGWLLLLLLNRVIHTEMISYLIVSIAISLYAEILARIVKTPTVTIIAPAMIPLVPGASLYYTMAYAFDGSTEKFLDKALTTLLLASALAIGVIVSAIITKIILRLVSMRKQAIENRHQGGSH